MNGKFDNEIKNDEKISRDKFISEALLEKLYLVVENEKEYKK